MTKPELFQARAYAKHWPSWKIRFLLTWVSFHGNVHQLKRQVIDIQTGVEGSLCLLSLSPHSPTVSFLSRQTVLWKMAYTLHFCICLWGNDSILQHLHHRWLKLWSLMCLVFTYAHLYIKNRGSHRKLLPVFPGNITTSPAPQSAQPRRPRCRHWHCWWGWW